MRKVLSFLALAMSVLAVLSCGGDPDDPVIQEDPAPTSVTATPATSSLTSSAGEVSIAVTSPQRPLLGGIPAWITVQDGTYNKYNITFTLKVAENTTYEPRSVTITVTSGGLSSSVTISQAAAEKPQEPQTPEEPSGDVEVNISKNLVTKSPMDKAVALYGYLLDQYGKKIISSIMADVNWNHREADKVNSATGKYPAMNCYDFIHIYVPENNWINYSDLKPVTEWAEAGGIVSLMWHFNVPKNKDIVPGTDGSGVTCTPGETTFRAKNVFTEGSWENKWFYGQMDKVAEVILGLQKQGIAAIWRPFHEAAGNATHKSQASWTTSWFWWGYDGAEIYKKLWVAMFDYFASKGIHNLIWVWTLDATPGTENEWASWYPGNDLVDIVGVDIYADDTDAKERQYKAAADLSAGHKMVTVSECGNIPEPIKCIAAGEKWCWFMAWDLESYSLNTAAYWKNVMVSSKVITRENMPSLK